MANELIFAEERQNKILEMLKLREKVLVNELCEEFSVSTATIRNDLNQLEKAGLLKRTHGGAMSATKATFEPTSSEKLLKNYDKKQRIAECASKFIENGDTVAIDTGTTTYCLAELLLGKKNVTVVTTDIKIATLLESAEGISVVLAGGMLRKGFSCTIGAVTNSILSSFNVDKVFIASNAVSDSGDICTPDIEQAKVKQTLISMGSQVFLLADSSKFESHSFARFGNISEVDTVITDSGIDPKKIKHFRSSGATFLTV